MPAKAQTVPAPVIFLRDRFGGDFEESEETIAVGTAAERITLNDPEAVSMTVVNTGTDNVTLGLTPQVTAGVGIILNPGGVASLTVRDDATLPTREWWAIGASAGQSVYVLRLRRYIAVDITGG